MMFASTPKFRRSVFRAALLFTAALIFAARVCFFTVPEGHAVVVTRWGRPVRVASQAGPYWKLPSPIDQIRLVDGRRKLIDTPPTAAFTRDKKCVVLTTFVVWRVDDPLLFLQAAGDSEAASTTIAGIVTATKNQELSRRDLTELVSVESGDIRIDEVEKRMTDEVRRMALARLGIEVERIGIQRVSLPRENIEAVLERMRAERETEAGRLRSEGAKTAQAIRDEAHVKSQEILRRGREEAGRITAAAEREAAEAYAEAHERDPEFHRFWSSLQASKRALGRNATIVLRSDRAFFDALFDDTTSSKRAETSATVESRAWESSSAIGASEAAGP